MFSELSEQGFCNCSRKCLLDLLKLGVPETQLGSALGDYVQCKTNPFKALYLPFSYCQTSLRKLINMDELKGNISSLFYI